MSEEKTENTLETVEVVGGVTVATKKGMKVPPETSYTIESNPARDFITKPLDGKGYADPKKVKEARENAGQGYDRA